jgi:hypothetical protein
MHTPNLGRPLDNKLLSTLPRDQFDLLAPHLTTVSLSQGEMLVGAGEEFDHVYFPHSGMLSLLAVLRDGKAIETATVGREGVVGAMAGFGLYRSQVRVIVQLPMAVSRISATKFRKATANSDAIRPVDRWDNRLVCIALPRQKLHRSNRCPEKCLPLLIGLGSRLLFGRFVMPSRNESARALARLRLETPISNDANLLNLQKQVEDFVREARHRDPSEPNELVSTVVGSR